MGKLPGTLLGSAAEVQEKTISVNSSVGCHVENNLREMNGTHDALINLVTADAANRETRMLQCKTITNLTASISALTQQLQQANTGYNSGSRLPVEKQGKAKPKWVNGKHFRDVGGYCWTHRHCVEISHDSSTCRIKIEGHRGNATRANNMGGNPYGNPRAWERERVGEIISNTKVNLSHDLRVRNFDPIVDSGATLNCSFMNSTSDNDNQIKPIRALILGEKR